jgi:hypothetical protein
MLCGTDCEVICISIVRLAELDRDCQVREGVVYYKDVEVKGCMSMDVGCK